MVLRRALVVLALAASAGQAALVGKDHVPRASSGCGKQSPVALGETTVRHLHVAGNKRLYRLRVPASYDSSKPLPLVISHHGWTCSAQEDERDGGLSGPAESEGFVVAYVQVCAYYKRSGASGPVFVLFFG